MKPTSALILFACVCSGAQVIQSGSGGNRGYFFRYETRVEPEMAGQKLSGFGGGIVADKLVHRYMYDSASKSYFGYDLAMEPEPGGTLRVTILPLSLSAEKLDLTGTWKQLLLPRLPPPQTVRTSDTLALDLFVHPVTGQKIVDYVTFEEGRPVMRLPSGEPRDYTVEDVPLTLSKTRLSLNGKLLHSVGGSISGEAVYFYLPGHGRYVFSLAPNQELGFRVAGEVRGNRLTITWGNNVYTIECDGPIAPGGGVFNLYVYPDPSWRPRRGGDESHMGSSNARSLVPGGR